MKFKENYNKSCKRTRHIKRKKEWMSNNCLMFRREVGNLGKKLQKSPNNCNLVHAFSQAKNEFHKKCKQLKSSFYKSVANTINELNPNCTKKIWNSLKSNMQNHIGRESPIKLSE